MTSVFDAEASIASTTLREARLVYDNEWVIPQVLEMVRVVAK